MTDRERLCQRQPDVLGYHPRLGKSHSVDESENNLQDCSASLLDHRSPKNRSSLCLRSCKGVGTTDCNNHLQHQSNAKTCRILYREVCDLVLLRRSAICYCRSRKGEIGEMINGDDDEDSRLVSIAEVHRRQLSSFTKAYELVALRLIAPLALLDPCGFNVNGRTKWIGQ